MVLVLTSLCADEIIVSQVEQRYDWLKSLAHSLTWVEPNRGELLPSPPFQAAIEEAIEDGVWHPSPAYGFHPKEEDEDVDDASVGEAEAEAAEFDEDVAGVLYADAPTEAEAEGGYGGGNGEESYTDALSDSDDGDVDEGEHGG